MKSHEIKDLLEERTIEASSQSWEQLANQLDAHDAKKKRTRLYPYAASVAVLLGLLLFWVHSNDEITATIVDTQHESTPSKLPQEKEQQIVLPEVEVKPVEKSAVVVNETVSRSQHTIVKTEKVVTVQLERSVAELQKEVQKTKVIPQEMQTVIAQTDVAFKEEQDIKASIAALSKTEKIAITDAEIEQLLNEAKKSLQDMETTTPKDFLTFATADELLEEVEVELDRSFKQKVFELIKNNLQKTRTVVADRD